MNRRKLLFNGLAAVVVIVGTVTTQWVMTHFPPSKELAMAFPAMLLGTGLIGGILAYFADPSGPELPKPSNDVEPRPGKVRVRIRRPGREPDGRS